VRLFLLRPFLRTTTWGRLSKRVGDATRTPRSRRATPVGTAILLIVDSDVADRIHASSSSYSSAPPSLKLYRCETSGRSNRRGIFLHPAKLT
jgi:hypothetical protein